MLSLGFHVSCVLGVIARFGCANGIAVSLDAFGKEIGSLDWGGSRATAGVERVLVVGFAFDLERSVNW